MILNQSSSAGESGIFAPGEFKWKSEISWLVVLGLLILLGNLPLLFQRTYQDFLAFLGDYHCGVVYAYNHLGESLRQGWFLLWGPGTGCGQPELAFYLPAFSYPLSVLFSLFSYPWREILFYLAHFELIGIFSYLLFRRVGISRASALVVSGWNAMSGYTIWISLIPSVIAPLCWFYLILYLLLQPGELGKARNFLLLVLGMTMTVLAGDPEEVIYAGYFLGLWVIGCWIFSRASFSRKTVLLILLAFGLALILSQAQILPTWNYLSRSVRSGKPDYQLYASSFFSLDMIIKALVGVFSRKFINLYFSFFALGFGLWGISGKKNSAIFSTLMVILVLLLILILPAIGLGRMVYSLPLYSHFVRHYKLGFIFQFLVLLPAGFGLDRFLAGLISDKKSLLQALLIFSIFCLAGFALGIFNPFLLLPLVIAPLFFFIPRFRTRPAVLLALLLMMDVFPYLWHPPYPFFEFKRARFWQEYEKIAGKGPGISRIQVFYPGLRISSRRRDFSLPPQVTGAEGGEGFDFYMSYPVKDYARFLSLLNPEVRQAAQNPTQIFNYNLPFKSRDYLKPETRHLINMIGLRWLFLDQFALQATDDRDLLYDPEYFLNLLRPRAYGGYQFSEIEVKREKFAFLNSEASSDFYYRSQFDPGDELSFRISAEKDPAWFLLVAGAEGKSRLLFARQEKAISVSDFFRVRIPVSSPELGFLMLKFGGGPAGWMDPVIRNDTKTIKYRIGDWPKLFENTEALPRGWLVHQARGFRDQEQLIKFMSDPEHFDPAKIVLISNPAKDLNLSFPATPGGDREQVQLQEYQRELIRLRANLASDGFLVWMDQYYPGWRADINGEEGKILKANLSFRALRLKAGEQEVIFQFQPLDFRIGLYLSIISGLFFLGISGAVFYQRIRSSS